MSKRSVAKKEPASKQTAAKKRPAVAKKPAAAKKRAAAPAPPVRMAAPDYDRARLALIAQDPRLGALIERVGPCTLKIDPERDLFSALCQTITSQQLSTRVAVAIYGRLRAACAPSPHPTPEAILRLDEAQLRAAGLSGPKARYVRALAERVAEGGLSLEGLEALSDDEVIDLLSSIKGIGRWSAQMILIFRLHRPDVWPTGDLGIVRGLERLHNLRKPPTLARLEKLGDVWRPYRSVAAWYLWAGANV
jgi:DNA-3-methyladenine glycosylase II